MKKLLIFSFLIIVSSLNVWGQKKGISLERALEIALENNYEYNAYKLKYEQSKALRPTALSIEKTNFFLAYDSNNMAENEHPLNIFGVEQSFSFPTVYAAQYKVADAEISLAEKELEARKVMLFREVTAAYYEIQYHMNRLMHYDHLDSVYAKFVANVQQRYDSEEIGKLDLINAKAKHQHIQMAGQDITYDTRVAYRKLRLLLNTDTLIVVPFQSLTELPVSDPVLEQIPGMQYMEQETALKKSMLKVEKHNLLPDISLSYSVGSNRFPNAQRYPGYEVGISLPLFFGVQKARIKAGRYDVAIAEKLSESYRNQLSLKILELYSEISKFREHLDYYYTTGKELGREIELSAQEEYSNGDIDYLTFVESIENATHIKLEYLETLFEYNNKVLELKYLVLED